MGRLSYGNNKLKQLMSQTFIFEILCGAQKLNYYTLVTY